MSRKVTTQVARTYLVLYRCHVHALLSDGAAVCGMYEYADFCEVCLASDITCITIWLGIRERISASSPRVFFQGDRADNEIKGDQPHGQHF
jgi:hypothetical protein